MWDKLAKQIANRVWSEEIHARTIGKVLTPFEREDAVKEEIQKFIRENVVQCFFKCDSKTAKKAKGSD